MSRGDLCNRCQHIRSAHTTVLGSEDTKCNCRIVHADDLKNHLYKKSDNSIPTYGLC